MSSRSALSSRRWLTAGLTVLGLATFAQAQFLPKGALLQSGDDVLTQGVALPFAFPYTDGLGMPANTMAISVSSNGWLKLTGAPASTSAELTEGTALFASQEARVAAHWDDLDNEGTGYSGGGVYFYADPTVAVVTWQMWEFGDAANPVVAQVQLYPNGNIFLCHVSGNDDCLIGVSQGGGVVLPAQTDLSALAGTTNLGWTWFQQWTGTGALGCDLPNVALAAASAALGYDVTLVACPTPLLASAVARGTGCPAAAPGDDGLWEGFSATVSDPYDLVPPYTVLYTWNPVTLSYTASLSTTVIYETAFATTVASYGWRVSNGDDGLSNLIPMGFVAPVWGGTLNAVSVNPNGYVYFDDGGSCTSIYATAWSSTCYGGTRGLISAVGTDLTEEPTDGNGYGTIYADTLPAAGALPQRFVVTWDGVARWNSTAPSPESVTTQVGIYPSGNCYATVLANNITRSQSIGFFRGTQTVNPGETNYSTALPIVKTSSTLPLKLRSDKPGLLSTPVATAYDLYPGTLASALHVGLDQTNVALDFLGMTGCTAYTLAISVILPMAPGGGGAQASLGLIPNSPALIGGTLTLQALSVAIGVNPLSIIASNGMDLTIGY